MPPPDPQTSDKDSVEKVQKKNKVHLFLSSGGIDILEKKTKVSDTHTHTHCSYLIHRLLSSRSYPVFAVNLFPSLVHVQYMLYTCPISTVSFCGVLPATPKVFGFVAKHPASDLYHCYLFQSQKFVSSHGEIAHLSTQQKCLLDDDDGLALLRTPWTRVQCYSWC